ncbi:unnamed protein product, partial [Polarella glacialis]
VVEGCKSRSFMTRSFGVAWVVTWCIMVLAFAFSHSDGWNHGKGSTATSSERPTPFQKVMQLPILARELSLLFSMMVCHTLAILGVWSFPNDLVSQILVGFLFTAGAVVTVRLAAPKRSRIPSDKYHARFFLEIPCFAAINVIIYVSIMSIPGFHGIWYVALLVGMMAFWGLFTAFVTDQQKARRGALIFAMLVFSAALPTLVSLLAGLVNRSGLWLAAMIPTSLLMLSVASERLIGPCIEQQSEYTAETQWLLATVFRTCIELVRFETALVVLLVSLITDTGFGYLVLHLAQTLVFEVMLRQPQRLCFVRSSDD